MAVREAAVEDHYNGCDAQLCKCSGEGNEQMTAHPNIVLVHGAWADGSSRSGVIQRLQNAGHKVSAAQLPLSSLAAGAARVRLVLGSSPTLLSSMEETIRV